MSLTLFNASFKVDFQESKQDEEYLLQEYFALNTNAKLANFKKMASKAEFSDSEEVLFKLLLSIKNDILRLESKLDNKENFLKLKYSTSACAIHYEYIKIKDPLLKEEEDYYFRFRLEGNDIAFFVKAIDKNIAKINKFRNDDKILYDNFVANMQREFLKERKKDDV